MYLGVLKHKKGYRLMDINSHDIVYSRDVDFDERTYPNLTGLNETPSQMPIQLPLTTPSPTIGSALKSTSSTPSASVPSQLSTNNAEEAWMRVREELKRNHYTFISDIEPDPK